MRTDHRRACQLIGGPAACRRDRSAGGGQVGVTSERLEAACRLLASPQNAGLPVSAVAARSGFTSPSHFTRRFRDAYGTTPREWRRHRNQGTPRPGPTAPPHPIPIP
ncbi:helix-turn-helix domain-containing protein [Streptomyces sp. NRRL F-4474]|uniref:helix-turn-helix domain-containing protein n=1 Tax=Streptomyces sp. NRRL F-4474 TaxID=1463851 RepID=UPI00099C2075|nr:helix-turn-helix domain-containing protein [Streptomyces sp. NRRL F-4474]